MIKYSQAAKNSTNVRFNRSVFSTLFHTLLSILAFIYRPAAKAIIKRLFFRPTQYKDLTHHNETFEKATPHWVESDGLKIQYWTIGKGPWILFDHGWGGRGIQFHAFFDIFLNAGYGVIFFDNPGHGVSGGKTSNYFRFSNAILKIYNRYQNKDMAGIVAHSLGGSAVINMLWKTGAKVPVVLIAPALDLMETLTRTFKQYGVPLSLFFDLISQIEVETGHQFNRENPKNLLAEIRSGITIIHDIEDRAIPFFDARTTALIHPHVNLIETSGLGHFKILSALSVIQKTFNVIDTGYKKLTAEYDTAPEQKLNGHLYDL